MYLPGTVLRKCVCQTRRVIQWLRVTSIHIVNTVSYNGWCWVFPQFEKPYQLEIVWPQTAAVRFIVPPIILVPPA